jgi:hypothetical protein
VGLTFISERELIADDGITSPEATFNTIAKQSSSTNPSKKRAGAARLPVIFFVKNELVKAQNDEYIFTEMIKKCKIQ